jgi:hypothetical protein
VWPSSSPVQCFISASLAFSMAQDCGLDEMFIVQTPKISSPTRQGHIERSLQMRKQHHFRRSERRLIAWDVDRLVALTKNFPKVHVPLTSIRELDESFWFGEGNPPTCREVVEHARLMDAADLGFPIILSSDGRVMDGMHRVAKAALLNRPTIEAVQFTNDPEPDYVDVHPDKLPYD